MNSDASAGLGGRANEMSRWRKWGERVGSSRAARSLVIIFDAYEVVTKGNCP